MADTTLTSRKPDELIRPVVSLDTAKSLVERLYGLKVKNIVEMPSYDDRNYKITVECEHSNPYIKELHKDHYTLKILNKKASSTQHVEAEHEMLRRLAENKIQTIKPILNIHGKELSREQLQVEPEDAIYLERGELSGVYVVRLMTFQGGSLLTQVQLTPKLLHQLGHYLATMTCALKDFNHPGLHKKFIWSLTCVSDLREFVFAVKDEKRQAMVYEIIESYETDVVPNFTKFTKGVLHGDFNEQNIIVKELPKDEQTAAEKHELVGVIDFGDASEAYSVMDVAIVIMYMMLDNKGIDMLEVGGYILAGYQRVVKLNVDEYKALRVLVACRFIQSLVMGAFSYSLDPYNEYLLITSKKGWDVLEWFCKQPNAKVYQVWDQIMSTYS